MTGLGVLRTPRTPHLLPSVPPVRATTPMPPHIQGAERRLERPARSAVTRWGLRALVIGGLAGAAWLLTGTAAHAANSGDGPDGSLLGAVVGSDATGPIDGLLQTAVQPLGTAHPARQQHHHQQQDVVSTVLDLPQRVLTRPVAMVTEIVHGATGITVDDAHGDDDPIPVEVADPYRLTGGSDDTPQQFSVAPQRKVGEEGRRPRTGAERKCPPACSGRRRQGARPQAARQGTPAAHRPLRAPPSGCPCGSTGQRGGDGYSRR